MFEASQPMALKAATNAIDSTPLADVVVVASICETFSASRTILPPPPKVVVTMLSVM